MVDFAGFATAFGPAPLFAATDDGPLGAGLAMGFAAALDVPGFAGGSFTGAAGGTTGRTAGRKGGMAAA